MTNLVVAVIVVMGGCAIYLRTAAPRVVEKSATQEVTVSEAEDSWNPSLAAASLEAMAAHKSIVVLFTDQDGQADPLPKNLVPLKKKAVFVRLAPPTGKDASLATSLTAERYAVTETPQLLLLDEYGRGIARALLTRETDAGAAVVIPMLNIRQSRDEFLARAAQSTGAAKGQALDAALASAYEFRSNYLPELREIVALNVQGTSPWRHKYLADLAGLELDSIIQQQVYPLIDKSDFQAAASKLEDLIHEWGPDSRKLDLLYAFKGQILASSGHPRDALAAFDVALRFAQEGGDSAARIHAARAQLIERKN
jgi:hypothetical protein